MWSKINAKESKWEKLTGRPVGFENAGARLRSYEAEVNKMGEGDPTPRMPQGLSNSEKRDLERSAKKREGIIKEATTKIKRLESQADSLDDQAKRLGKTGDHDMARKAKGQADGKRREIAQIKSRARL